ncbi:MAG TPA: hypothetical protein VF060_02180 [Trebonia sp.]
MHAVTDGAGVSGGPEVSGSGRRVRGGWLWGVSGLVTAMLIAAPAALLFGRAGLPEGVFGIATGTPAATHLTFTVPQPVRALTVDSYGAMVRIRAGAVSRVTVSETIPAKASGGTPQATHSVSGGRLTVTNSACANNACAADFTITVPADVTADVSSQGGPVMVSGTAGATIESGGGAVGASRIGGPLAVSTDGGPLTVTGLAGTLNADTGGGIAIAQDVSAASADISTEGGPAMVGFAAPPRSLIVRTGGGTAQITVPGGPYALAADSGGGPEAVEVATDPSAPRSLTVTTQGGQLFIG